MTEESSNSQQLQRTKFVIEQKSVKKTFFQEHKTIIKQVRKRNITLIIMCPGYIEKRVNNERKNIEIQNYIILNFPWSEFTH